ncbi:MAG: ABC transporter ATP-binding protein [Candidatus Sericytochromatia bacterium]
MLFSNHFSNKIYYFKYLSYYKEHKKNILFSFILSLIQVFSLFPISLLIQNIFDNILPNKNYSELFLELFSIFILFTINSFSILWNRDLILRVVKSVIYNIRNDLILNFLSLDKKFYVNQDIDKIHSKIVNDSEKIDYMSSAIMAYIIPSIFIIIVLTIFLSYINFLLFIIVISILSLLSLLIIFFQKNFSNKVKISHSSYENFSKGISFILRYNDLIKVSANEKREYQTQEKIIDDLKISSRNMALSLAIYTVLQNNLLTLSGVIVLLIGGLQVIKGSITSGQLLSFYVALSFLGNNAKNIINNVSLMIEGKESLITVMSLFEDNKIIEGKSSKSELLYKTIELKNLFFSYDNNFSLDNINLKIANGEVIGLLGTSGSGKSTIINLILGFYNPSKGFIKVDNIDIKSIPLNEYRRNIGVLLQDPLIFSATIKENLTYGLEVINEGEIEEICKMCDIHSFIINLDKGYETWIGEKGVKISGGQKQRIAIARLLLRKPKLIILDEPDNNLDEEIIINMVKKIKKLKINTIIVTHNQKLYRCFDRLYEFNNKNLLEITN